MEFYDQFHWTDIYDMCVDYINDHPHTKFGITVEHLDQIRLAGCSGKECHAYFSQKLDELIKQKEKLGKSRDAVAERTMYLRQMYGGGLATCDKDWKFITITYDQNKVTHEVMLDVAERIKSLKGLKYIIYVHEKYRRDVKTSKIYEYLHTHFLIRIDLENHKLLDRLWATKVIKDNIVGKSNIDIRDIKKAKKLGKSQKFEDYIKYIHGDKVEYKLELIELDKKWREKYNMESFGEIL